ncbi:hypothetical protein B0I12_002554 [Microbacterium hydrothermale]|uniref:hypothetical protein n=1 Tax=Microbacterium hydrothermale TaxID=857427 RepID=UPI002227BD1B|nr:hypothetical protein [Microbacterium hydrothermale]MCW2165399.1 hypothetical protein [Microbacterium hydrothermale]
MFHVHTPQPSTGTTTFLDVEFHDGVAHLEDLHPVRELALMQHGYRVETDRGPVEVYPEGQGGAYVDLNTLTVPQLRELADADGVDLPAKARRDDIIAILSALPPQPIPGSVDNGDGSFTAPGIHKE